MDIREITAQLKPADREYYISSQKEWDTISMPLGGLGILQDDISKISAIKEELHFKLENRTAVIVCADNGVIRNGVSQSDESVTLAVAKALGADESTVNIMAKTAGCKVLPIDIGMKYDTPLGVENLKIKRGCDDIKTGPAMTREECEAAILKGISTVEKRKARGDDILLLGEMGIGNTTTSTAVASVLLGAVPESVTGRGAGLSDEGLKRKIETIKTAIMVNAPDERDPIDVIAKVGGLDIAFLCGMCIGGLKHRMPLILDGAITNVAALAAVRLNENIGDALIASHVSAEPLAKMILDEMGLTPAITAGAHLGEGTGAMLMLPLLDQALALYNSRHTFEVLGIEAYKPR